MELTYKKTRTLTEDGKNVREAVFIKEQGFLKEFDEIDSRAVHLVIYDKDSSIAACRYFAGNEEDVYIVGRVAVRKEYRKMHIGNYVMEAAEVAIREDGGKRITLSAQARVRDFYEKLGYQVVGKPYMDEHCEHIRMVKNLKAD